MLTFTASATALSGRWTAATVQAALPDTVAMAPVRDVFDYLGAGVIVLTAVGMVLALLILMRILATIRQLGRSVDPLVKKAESGIEPVLERARSVAENVDYVSHAIRTDVEGLTRAIERIRGRLDQASDHMEDRIEEFNALLEVVQDEAEEIFLDTASTVRGVRQGSKALSSKRDEPPGDESRGDESREDESRGEEPGMEESRSEHSAGPEFRSG